MSALSTELDAALDRLDLAFADPPSSFVHGVCDRCFTPSQLATLAGPVGEVPDELVVTVMAGWWEHHWEGMPALIHRLAARFLRLLVTGQFEGLVEETGRMFWEAEWQSWPQATEVQAVLEAWLAERPTRSAALEFVIAATRLVVPWLERLPPEQLREVLETVYLYPEDEASTAIADWLLEHGLDVLSQLSEGTDEALARLADLEYWRQMQ